MAEHTKGPWSTTGHFIYGSDDRTIAEVEEARNSAVITASPEMFDALLRCYAWLCSGEAQASPYHRETYQIVQNAIRKAEGV